MNEATILESLEECAVEVLGRAQLFRLRGDKDMAEKLALKARIVVAAFNQFKRAMEVTCVPESEQKAAE